jgi:hypothetical protein
VNVDAILTAIYVLTNNSLKSGQSSIVIQQWRWTIAVTNEDNR